jgi:hypothetical protein
MQTSQKKSTATPAIVHKDETQRSPPIRKGMLTFEAEGNNMPNNRYYSLKIHWPENAINCSSSGSGVTIGRGFDLGNRTESESLSYFLRAGIDKEHALSISKSAGLKGCDAMHFVRKHKNAIPEISPIQQKNLFNIVYPEYIQMTKNLYQKYKKKDSPEWDQLDERIQEVMTDMRYQGRLIWKDLPIFENNDRDKVVQFIQMRPELKGDEPTRKRIQFLKGK